ncbi:DUF4394 domain-containing protein [Streptomyces sp. NPDC060194]|uniref:DUF4394 domain-containing protein n=1 Tax=Streptomyces sp. NPDC060194 TaxID=3347069 RepID=UPI00364BF34F
MRTRTAAAALSTVAALACMTASVSAVADDGPSGRDSARPFADRQHSASARPDLMAVGLTADQRLVGFNVRTPGKPWSYGKLKGLSGDRKLVGIDFRVQNGALYGVGDRGGIYTLTEKARAKKVSQLTAALNGTNFGVDFNPAANRLRVVSDTGQNLRHNIDDPAAPVGTIADTVLTNPTMPAPTTALGVTGAAYTNNDLNPATATSLFDIDTANDRVSLQSPANAGTLAPTGNLGVAAGPDAGFDVYTGENGANSGFAVLRTAQGPRLYAVDLLGGRAGDRGAFPGSTPVTDLALPLGQA